MTDLVARAVLKADGTALVLTADQSAAALGKVRAAADQASTSGKQMGFSFDATAAALEGQARAAEAANRVMGASGDAKKQEIANLTAMTTAHSASIAKVDALTAAYGEYDSGVSKSQALLAAGLITERDHAANIEGYAGKLALAKVAAEGMGGAARTAEVDLTALERMMAASGVQAGLAGGQIRILRDGLKALPGVVEAYPVASAFTVIAAMAGIAFMAEEDYAKSVNRLNVTLAAHALVVMGTSGDYLKLADNIASAADVSEKTGRTMAGAFADANLSPGLWNDIAGMAKDYAAVLGTDVPEAAEKWSQSLLKPYDLAKQLTEQYGLLDQKTLLHIRDLEEEGKTEEAQKTITDAWGARIKNAADQTTGWAWAWTEVKKNVGGVWDALGKVLFPGQDAKRHLASLQLELNHAQQGIGTQYIVGPGQVVTMAPRTEAEILADIKRVKQEIADAAKFSPEEQARNREAFSLSSLVQGFGPGSFDQQLASLQNARQRIIDDYAKGIKATDTYGNTITQEQALLAVDQKITEVKKQQREAILNLDDAARMWEQRVKSLIAQGPETIAQARLEADTAVGRSKAYLGGEAALQRFNDQQQILSATLPLTTALAHAQGSAHEALQKQIDSVTAAETRRIAAENLLAARQDIDQQIGSASGYMSDALAAAQYAQAKKNIDDWYLARKKVLSASGADSERLSELELLHMKKVQDAYDEDLSNRRDWASGITRGNQDLVRSQQDWASKSEAFIKGWASTSEEAFVNFAKTGKASLGDFENFLEEQIARMAYQRYVAASMNAVGNAFLGAIDSVFSFGGSSSGSSNVNAGEHHRGGYAGSPYVTRDLPASLFTNAVRAHDGRRILGNDEVPVVTKIGEEIVTREQQTERRQTIDALTSALTQPMILQLPPSAAPTQVPAPEIHFHSDQGVRVRQKTSTTSSGAPRTDIWATTVDQLDNAFADRVMGGRSATGNAIAQRHGLPTVMR